LISGFSSSEDWRVIETVTGGGGKKRVIRHKRKKKKKKEKSRSKNEVVLCTFPWASSKHQTLTASRGERPKKKIFAGVKSINFGNVRLIASCLALLVLAVKGRTNEIAHESFNINSVVSSRLKK